MEGGVIGGRVDVKWREGERKRRGEKWRAEIVRHPER